jgi:hypothetical protein
MILTDARSCCLTLSTRFYSKALFWHLAYFVGSVGAATLETVRASVDAQGTQERARMSTAKRKTKPSAWPPPDRSAYAWTLLRNGTNQEGECPDICSIALRTKYWQICTPMIEAGIMQAQITAATSLLCYLSSFIILPKGY